MLLGCVPIEHIQSHLELEIQAQNLRVAFIGFEWYLVLLCGGRNIPTLKTQIPVSGGGRNIPTLKT